MTTVFQLPSWTRRSFVRTLERYVKRRSALLVMRTRGHNVGIGQKTRRRRPTSDLSVVLFVEQKSSRARGQLPKHLYVLHQGCRIRVKTDVRESPRFGQLCSIYSGELIHGGGRGYPSTPGSCGVAWQVKGQKYLITCAHLFFDPVDPRHATYCQDQNLNEIGFVEAWVPLSISAPNSSDVALVSLYPGTQIVSQGVGGEPVPIVKISPIDLLKNDYFYVYQSQEYPCQAPVKSTIPWGMPYKGKIINYINTYTFSMPNRPIREGHSGSMLMRRTPRGLEAVGIIFAMAGPAQSFAFPADDMFKRVGVPV